MGGIFKKDNELKYVGGEVKIYEDIDPDELCYFWLQELACIQGKYSTNGDIYFLIPGLSLDTGLRRIFNDVEVLEMAKYATINGSIQIYVVHSIDTSLIAENESMHNILFQFARKKLTPLRSKEKQSNVIPFDGLYHDLYDHRPDSPLRYKDLVSDVINNDDPVYNLENDDDDTYGEGLVGFVNKDLVCRDDDVDIDAEIQDELQDHVIGSNSDTSDDESRAVRQNLNLWNTSIMESVAGLQKEAEEGRLKGQKNIKDIGHVDESGYLSEYEDSDDEIITPGESEEEDILGKKRKIEAPLVNGCTDFSKLEWKVGMKFPNRQQFKDAVAKYSIFQGRHLTFRISNKNRQQRVGVECKEGCPFKLYGSWDSRRACFVVKSVDNKHKCNRNMKMNRQMKSTWLAEQFLEVFKSRPHWPASEICDTVRRAYRVIIKRGYAYKVKYWAHKKLHGSMKDHYNKICSYIQALKETSPNCVFKIQTEPSREPNPLIFKRFFACFDALSEGWLEGCRKIICLDGCFLKTFLGGMLLAAVGRDANHQMYPIAWAVVEGENNDSWEWFLLELRSCLREKNEGDGWTFISDQQKGILNVVSHVFWKAEHRNCARHIFVNWHKTYKGDELKGLFWRAVRAYNMADYNAAIVDLDRLNQAAATALKAQNPKTFCRAFVKTNTKCDVIVNNMAETFNGYIINARTKHLIYMLEDIRTALMQRLVNKKVYMKKLDTLLCPRIQVKLDKEKDEARNCHAMPSSEVLFQVNHKMLDNVNVDLLQKTCTCGKWQLTGIPCCHAIACIYLVGDEAESYVDKCYYTTTYLKSYSRAIHPYKGERYWAKLNMPIDPPQIKIGPGRPRRNRRKDPHENPKKPGRLTRHGTELTCSVCKSTKHTKRKCPDKDKVVESQPKRGKGRPRKYGVTQPSQRQFETANLSTHHNISAEPSRTARGGRTITRGRTFKNGNTSRGDEGRNLSTVGKCVLNNSAIT